MTPFSLDIFRALSRAFEGMWLAALLSTRTSKTSCIRLNASENMLVLNAVICGGEDQRSS